MIDSGLRLAIFRRVWVCVRHQGISLLWNRDLDASPLWAVEGGILTGETKRLGVVSTIEHRLTTLQNLVTRPDIGIATV